MAELDAAGNRRTALPLIHNHSERAPSHTDTSKRRAHSAAPRSRLRSYRDNVRALCAASRQDAARLSRSSKRIVEGLNARRRRASAGAASMGTAQHDAAPFYSRRRLHASPGVGRHNPPGQRQAPARSPESRSGRLRHVSGGRKATYLRRAWTCGSRCQRRARRRLLVPRKRDPGPPVRRGQRAGAQRHAGHTAAGQ